LLDLADFFIRRRCNQ